MIRLRIARTSPETEARIIPCIAGDDVPEPMRAAATVAGFTGAAGETCEVFSPTERILLAGVGAGDYEAAGAAGVAVLTRLRHVALDARGLAPQQAAQLAAGAMLRAWRRDQFVSQTAEDAPRLVTLDLLCDRPAAVRAAWREMGAGVVAANFARDLVLQPGNLLTPAGFVARLRRMLRPGLTLEVLDQAALAQRGMGALLAVGQGSVHPPCLAILRWAGAGGERPVAFIGKGITFDTGGLCIKPAQGMEEMRGDMAGAAAAAGAVLALASRNSPCPAIAVLALAENATGAASYRPGDVLRSHAGLTIEVVDTDAEGRLVLADALAWTVRHAAPRVMIDLATLTGSIVTALGTEMAGAFATDDALAEAAIAAGAAVGERLWRMPLGEGYRADLASDIADLKHCLAGRGHPDACHAAAFLREFAGTVPWLHLDIAGVSEREESGPTGFGVRLLDRLVAEHFERG